MEVILRRQLIPESNPFIVGPYDDIEFPEWNGLLLKGYRYLPVVIGDLTPFSVHRFPVPGTLAFPARKQPGIFTRQGPIHQLKS
jgi:hypothetical protein